ncbi:MAG: DUF2589 domain-containing protein [Tannerella sp.]|jgi:hypothetical protein|nr:DUF2589 domain-containing protein [Tannerella sp.]
MARKEKENTVKTVEKQMIEANVTVQAMEIIEAAKSEIMNPDDETDSSRLGDNTTTDVAGKFKGLPMRDLIGGPLIAAAEAQANLAATAWDYYKKIAYNDDGKTTRILEFDIERPVEENGKMTPFKQKVKAPFIGLVPIPALLIEDVQIDFQMEVTDNNTSSSRTTAEASTSIKTKWWAVNAEVSGKVSSSRENTRATNQTAKYQVHVKASQQPQTEGLSKLMDVMASCIEPIPSSQ